MAGNLGLASGYAAVGASDALQQLLAQRQAAAIQAQQEADRQQQLQQQARAQQQEEQDRQFNQRLALATFARESQANQANEAARGYTEAAGTLKGYQSAPPSTDVPQSFVSSLLQSPDQNVQGLAGQIVQQAGGLTLPATPVTGLGAGHGDYRFAAGPQTTLSIPGATSPAAGALPVLGGFRNVTTAQLAAQAAAAKQAQARAQLPPDTQTALAAAGTDQSAQASILANATKPPVMAPSSKGSPADQYTAAVLAGDPATASRILQTMRETTNATTQARTDVTDSAPTMQTRQMAEVARQVLPHIQTVQTEAQQLQQMGLMGPVGGRWRDFMAGTVGAGQLATSGTPQQRAQAAQALSKFRTDVGLLSRAVMRASAGSRGAGSAQMLEQMDDLIGAGGKDLPTFLGSLDGVKDWMTGYAEMAGPQTGSTGGSVKPDFTYVPGKGWTSGGGGS